MFKKKSIFLFLVISLFLVSFISATTLETFGTFKVNENVRFSQVCSDATYINISSISYPNSSTAVSNIEMVSAGSGEFYYDFNSTEVIGRYYIRGISDGCTNTFATYLDITDNGKPDSEGIIIIVFILIFIALFIFGLVYFFISLDHVLKLDMDMMDAIIMISNYFAVWVFYYFCQNYFSNALMNDFLLLAIKIGAITHVFLPLVGFLLSYILTTLQFKQKQKTTY